MGDGSTSTWNSLSTRMLLATAFGAVSAALLVVKTTIFSDYGRAHAMVAWLTLIVAQGAIAGFGCLDAVAGYRSACRKPDGGVRLDGVVFVIVFLFLLLATFVGVPHYFKLGDGDPLPLGPQHEVRVSLVCFLDGFSGLGAAAAIWAVAREAEPSKEGEAKDEARFFALRGRLSGYVSFLGLQIGAAVLSTGMLRHVMIDGHWVNEDTFPPELVLSYGAYFTVLVGIVYFLAASRLNELAEHLVEQGLPGEDAEPWDRIKRRMQVAKALGLEGGVAKQFKAAVAILGPLVSALVSIAIPHG